MSDAKKFMYRVSKGFSLGLARFEIMKETPKQVVYLNHNYDKVWTENRSTVRHTWFYTFSEAHGYVLSLAKERLERAQLAFDEVTNISETNL